MTMFSRLPPITLTVDDRKRFGGGWPMRAWRIYGQAAVYLARVVERARIFEAHQDARNFVRMGAWLNFATTALVVSDVSGWSIPSKRTFRRAKYRC